MNRTLIRRWAIFLFAIPLALLALQFTYYATIYTQPKTLPTHYLALIYSGDTDRLGEGLDFAKKDPTGTLLCSGWDYSLLQLQKVTGLPARRFIVEDKSRTTDQNARYSKPFIL